MSEGNQKCRHQDWDYEEKVPRTLATVLLREYRHLGIFSRDEVQVFEQQKIDNESANNLECFVCLREEYESGKIGLEEYKRRNRGRDKIRTDLLKGIRQSLNNKEDKPIALCFSGGGIRSATFNLGILQGLAKHGLLNQFHYLSTVSGGGYIGGWLSAWINREKNGIDRVQKELNPKNYIAGEVEPETIKNLRKYSNYMSPRLGLLSSDTLTLIAVYLRNLLLNWTVLLPIIAAILLLPRVFLSIFDLSKTYIDERLPVSVAVYFVICGIIVILLARPSLQKADWFKQNYGEDDIYYSSNADKKVFIWCFLPIIISALLFVIYLFKVKESVGEPNWEYFVIFGGSLFLISYVPFYFITRKVFNEKEKKEDRKVQKPSSIGEAISLFIEKYPRFFEGLFSILGGGFGGYLLYLAAKYFADIVNLVRQTFPDTPENVIFVCLGVPVFLTVFLLSATLYVGLVSKFTDDMDREWISRYGSLILLAIVGWLVVSITVLFGHRLFIEISPWKNAVTSLGGLSGLLSLIISFSPKSKVKNEEKKKSWTDTILSLAPQIAAPLFILVFMALISFITLNLLKKTEDYWGIWNPFLWLVIFGLVSLIMGLFININKFSLHAIYRERIIRAYLGASNKKFYENANSYIGLDSENDNLEMRELLKNRPFHVVNMTLNLAKPHNLAWQSRRAESFTVTPLYCGSSNMGGAGNYRSTGRYGGAISANNKPITLGTAVAISGAAASPNMGYYTLSSSVIFLMVLFNIRLGWWLGNTGLRGKNTWQFSSPVWSPKIFFEEALGRTTDEYEYINLSDGGHFENLGLYEMVLRRCKLIIVCDSGADGDFSFSDFAVAIHKIRVDFGISIEFRKGSEPKEGRNCAIGTIKYDDVDGSEAKNGTLIYIKPTLDGNEPIDLINYKKKNTDFPHETTADQFFGETQFESYRTLGLHQIDSICNGGSKDFDKCEDIIEIKNRATEYLKKLDKKKRR